MPRNGSPGLDLGQLTELLVAVRRAGPLLAAQAGHRDVAVLVVERGERVEQREQRVGRGAAELAAVLRAGERPRLDGRPMPCRAGPTVSVGTPGRKLPMSPITIASAANSSGRDGG